MKLINLYAGPGAGKSTVAVDVFSYLKKHKVKTELVGEFAKELIYLGNETQLVNQVYIMGCQYRKLKDLQRHGIDVAVSDSPLLLQLVYCRDKPYYKEIKALNEKLNDEFQNINVFIKRTHPYQVYGRTQNEYQAKELDKVIWDSLEGQFHYVIESNDEEIDYLNEELLKIVDKELYSQF